MHDCGIYANKKMLHQINTYFRDKSLQECKKKLIYFN